MATYTAQGSRNSTYTLELNVAEDSYSTSANNSSVAWNLYLVSTTYYFSMIGMTALVSINGEEVLNSYAQRSMSKNDRLLLGSGTLTVPHDSNGSKTINVSASLTMNATDNYLPGNTSVSGILKLTDIPRYATSTQSLSSKTINAITMKWSSDSIIDYIWYSKDNGSTWTGINVTDGTSGTYTISNLSPNTTYKIKTRVRRKDSQLTTDSSALSVTTYDIAKISSASNFNLGSNAIITITNPANATATLAMKIGATQILSKNLSIGANTIIFTDTQLDNIYKKFTTSNSISISYTLTTNSNSNWTNSKNVTCTLTGNQKTGHINVNSSWKRTKKWINVDNVWKRCVRWVNVNGTWKRCI